MAGTQPTNTNFLSQLGAGNREQAIKWLVEADEDALWDIEHFVWKHGFLFTDRGRALVKEITDLYKAA